MNRIKWSGVLFGVCVFLFIKSVMAIDLTLTRIGVLSTIGVDYSIVDYTGTIPTLEGTASPSAQVLIRIKTSTDATVAASPSGVWRFSPGVLDSGASSIVITSGGQSLAFVLNFNATPAATITPTPTPIPDELPATGVWEYYLPGVVGGILVLLLGKFIREKMIAWEGKKDSRS